MTTEVENKNPNTEKTEQNNEKEILTSKLLNVNVSKYTLTTNKWKVKFYQLNKSGEWTDNGVGYIFCTKNDEAQKLVMINEDKEKEEERFSIELKQNNNVVFHKQRGTIITWKENPEFNEDDSALSFKEKEGFIEIFKNILLSEGKDPEKEPFLLEEEGEGDNIFEVSYDNLPNLIREISTDMGDEKIFKFIIYLRESNCEFVKQLGKLLDEEEKKMEESTAISTSSDISSNNNVLNKNSNVNTNTNTNTNIINNNINNGNINNSSINNSNNTITNTNSNTISSTSTSTESNDKENQNPVSMEIEKENDIISEKNEKIEKKENEIIENKKEKEKENTNGNGNENVNVIDKNKKAIPDESNKDFYSSPNSINTNNNNTNKAAKGVFSMEKIHYIYIIFKNLLLIGNETIYQILLDDDCYLITFGALEYELETQEKISNHRDYFLKKVKFKNPLNITDKQILDKINLNIRLIYLKDIAFARFIDENSTMAINSILQSNYESIIQYFLENKNYIDLLCSQMQSNDLSIKKEACLLLLDLLSCTKSLPQTALNFKETLCEKGLLELLSQIINDIIAKDKDSIENNPKDKELIEKIDVTVIEIIVNILSSIPNKIKDYLKKEDNQLFSQLTNLMLYYDSYSIKYEVSQIYKNLIENDIPRTFCQSNYNKNSISFFQKPFYNLLSYLEVPIKEDSKNQNEVALTKQVIIEIFMIWFSQKSCSNNFIFDKHKIDVIINTLLNEKNKIINLYAVKLLRTIVEHSNEYMINSILNNRVCQSLSNLFEKNKEKNNIIISCMMDFFDIISKIHEPVLNILMTLIPDFFYNNHDYFENFLLRAENKDPPKRQLYKFLNPNLSGFGFIYPIEDDKEFDEYYIFNDKEEDEDANNEFLLKKRNSNDKVSDIFKSYGISSDRNNSENKVGTDSEVVYDGIKNVNKGIKALGKLGENANGNENGKENKGICIKEDDEDGSEDDYDYEDDDQEWFF